MKKYLGIFFLCICSLMMFSCSSDDGGGNDKKKPLDSDHTVIVFFPYTINLYNYLSNNILDMEAAMLRNNNNPNVLVYINETKKTSHLYSIRREGNVCVHDTLCTYTDYDNTSADALASLFSEIKTYVPNTQKYDMIIGCHGMGWIYGDDYGNARAMKPKKYMDQYAENPITRWMGVTSAMIDIDKFAQSLERASLHPNMMLFDVCYMSNIESVFELRNTADYIVASPIEIMGKGMPYQLVWDDIVASTPQSMENICYKAYNFYNNSDQPYAALTTIDCKMLDNLASVVKEINQNHKFDELDRSGLQKLDGYKPHLFYDMSRYVELQCKDSELYGRYQQAMSQAVISNHHTNEYFTSLSQGSYGPNQISYCCGLTTSAPSEHELSNMGLSRTSWYKATH